MGQVSNETLCSMPSFSRMYSLSWRLWGAAGGTVKGLAHALACPGPFREGPRVAGSQQTGKRRVPLQERAAGRVAEAGEPPPFYPRDVALDCGVLPGTSGPSRAARDARGRRAGCRVARRAGAGAHRPCDAPGPRPGAPTPCRTGADIGPHPVGQPLAPGRFSTASVGGSQAREEERGGGHCPWERSNHGDSRPRRVDQERLARAVAWPHPQSELPSPLALGFPALAVLEASGGERLGFLPHQDQGAPLACASPGHRAPVRERTSRHRGWGSRGTQWAVQDRGIERVWERPGQTRRLRAPHIRGVGGAAAPEAVRHCAVPQTTGPFEPYDVAALAHRSPLGWPLLLPPELRKRQDTEGGLSASPRAPRLLEGWQVATRSDGRFQAESVATFDGNRWQVSTGIRGNLRAEYAHVATAAAINIDRIVAWLEERPRATTRTSRFAVLAPVHDLPSETPAV